MSVVAWDTETALFRPGVQAPELACVTWQRPGHEPRIVHASDSLSYLRDWFTGSDIMVGHNIAYDLGVVCAAFAELIPLVFDKFDRGEITDTMIRQQLLDIAEGEFRRFKDDKGEWKRHGYSLDDLCARHLGRRLDKDTWRMRYGEFIAVPLSQWPEGARTYPLEDARATLSLYQVQETEAARINEACHDYKLHDADVFGDQFKQTRDAFALQLASLWGLRTDGESVEAFAAQVQADFDEDQRTLMHLGLVRSNGTADTAAARTMMERAYAGARKAQQNSDNWNADYADRQ